MRSLRPLVVWLVLATHTSITICALGTTPMFTDCSNITSNFTNSSSGDFEAIGCNYPSKETNISLGLGAETTATVYIAYGNIAAGASASLWVQCPADAISKSLSITVTGIAFGQDASFRFTGALPAHSSLHISNNTFFLTQQNQYTLVGFPNSGIYYTTAILIGAWGTALVLEEGTTMSASNNTVTSRWAVGGTDQVVAVAVVGASATLKSMSALSMSGNSITSSSGNYAYVAYLQLYRDSGNSVSLTLYNQSAIAMNANIIIGSSFTGSAYVSLLVLSISSSSSNSTNLTLYNQSAINMSGNSIINSSFGSAYVAYLYLSSSSSTRLTLYNQSVVAMSGNSITNSSYSNNVYVARFYLSSYSGISLALYDQSDIDMNCNSIINSSGSFGGCSYVAYLHHSSSSSSSSSSSTRLTLYDQSAIAMSGNSINSIVSGSAFVACLYLTSSGHISLTLYNQSAIAMSGNSIINSIIWDAYAVFLYVSSGSISSSLTLYNQSAIDMSRNSIINSSIRSVYLARLFLSSSSGISLSLYNKSAIALSGNSIINSSYGRAAYVAYLYLSSSSRSNNGLLTLANQSAISLPSP